MRRRAPSRRRAGPTLTIDRTLGKLTVTPQLFSPNGDGRRETVAIGFTLTRSATVRLRILQGTTTVATLLAGSAGSGLHTVTWNGKNATDGELRVVAEATTSLGTRSLERGLVRDTRKPRARVLEARKARGGGVLLRVRLDEPALLVLRFDAETVKRQAGIGIHHVQAHEELDQGPRLRAGRRSERPHDLRPRPLEADLSALDGSALAGDLDLEAAAAVDPDADAALAVHGHAAVAEEVAGRELVVERVDRRPPPSARRRARGARAARPAAARGARLTPSTVKSDAAGTFVSAGSSSGRWFTFSPIPRTTTPSRRSAKTPATLLPSTSTSLGHLIWLGALERVLHGQGGRDAADERELGRPALGGGAQEHGAEDRRPGRRLPRAAEPPAPGDLLVAHGDGALGQAGVEERLRRRALRLVAVRRPEGAAEERCDGVRGERIGRPVLPRSWALD